MKKEISYKNEIYRKLIHLCSLSIPISYLYVTKEFALTVLFILAILFISVDILSKFFPLIKELVLKYFGSMMRSHEIEKKFVLNGASWVFISAIMCILIFPKIVVVASFSILIISDIAAALIGKKYGKHKLFTKSLEGTSAFIISAFFVITIVGFYSSAPWVFFVFGYLASIFGGIIEAASEIIKFDDNLSIPLSIGLILLIGEFVSNSLFNISFIYLLN